MHHPSLQVLGVDVRALARQRRGERQRGGIVPAAVLKFTRLWLKLGGKSQPLWSQLHLADVGDVAAYLTAVKCIDDRTFNFEFVGSAVASLLGEDPSGQVVGRGSATWADIDWYARCHPVAQIADIQTLRGTANPPYTSAVDFIAADFPFMDDARGVVSHIVGITVPKLN